jgi:hypothetical protein
MTRPEIINALREAIALLEAGDKAVARPVLERRTAEPPATDDERMTFRQATVRFVDSGVSKAGKPWARLTTVFADSGGEHYIEKWPAFDESVIDAVQLIAPGDEVAIRARPRRGKDGEQSWVLLDVQLVKKGAPKPSGPTMDAIDDIPF